MGTFELPADADRFVLHFDTDRHEVNAYALATALTGLANAVKEANAIVNPGHAVEVVVERMEDGSFRATVKTVFKKSKDIFSHEASKAIIYGIIATYIYEQASGPDPAPVVIVNDDSVIVQTGSDRIIVPRNVYEAEQLVRKSERFESSMGQVFNGALSDKTVTGLKLTPVGKWPRFPAIPRSSFDIFIDRQSPDDANAVVEDANLEISRAILSRGKRKWEFYWRGIKIAAPVTDQRFYDEFFDHEIRIAPGDVLRAKLRIHRKKDVDSGILMNSRYEVIEVIEHIPRVGQPQLT